MHSPAHETSPPEEPPFLIAAASGRALAASAARGGYSTFVLDWFADTDTRSVALATARVCARGALCFDEALLLERAQELAPPASCAGLVFGSGFEDRTSLLAELSIGRQLYGNTPSTVSALKDPRCFFPLLDELGIMHPEVVFERPRESTGWLLKCVGGSGGGHIKPAQQADRNADEVYFQRVENGRSLSATFLANGERAHCVGFNEQWHAGLGCAAPYLYGGAVGGVRLSGELEHEIGNVLDDLVSTTGLVGLNGMDFLLSDGKLSVLEINPRPTSTVELYDEDYAGGLFHWHVRTLRGELPDVRPASDGVRAHLIVFAGRSFRFDPAYALPQWCSDVPEPGTHIAAGQPVFTIHAAGHSSEQAARALRERRRLAERVLPAVAA